MRKIDISIIAVSFIVLLAGIFFAMVILPIKPIKPNEVPDESIRIFHNCQHIFLVVSDVLIIFSTSLNWSIELIPIPSR